MAFFEYRLNPDITFGAKGGPVFRTTRAYSVSGARQSNKEWTYPLHSYNFEHCLKTQTDYAEVRNLFYNVSGAFDGFRWKDWNDYTDENNGVLTIISGANYQLFKNYTIGSRTFSRKIQKPVASIVVIRNRAGTVTDITSASSIDYTTGIVGVSGHVSGDTYTWRGEFDVPVEFVSDELMPVILTKNGNEFLIESPQLEVKEIRL